MPSKRKRRFIVAAVLVILSLLFVPLPVRDIDRENVIADAALALRDQRRLLLDWQYIPFYDSGLITKTNRTWYYTNETPLSSANLERLGLLPLPEALRAKVPGNWYEKGNLLIAVTCEEKSASNRLGEPHLRLNVYHGSLGAQGYRVHVYRCLLGSFAYYTCEWVS